MTKPLEVFIGDGQQNKVAPLRDAQMFLVGIKKGYDAATSRAMNRAATSGRSAAVRTIREEYTIKASTVRSNFKILKATRTSLEAIVYSKGPQIPLVNYRVSPKTDTTGAKRKQVRVAVKKKGGLKPLGQSFIYKGRPLQRLGSSSLPVKEVYGPAIPLIAGNDAVQKNVEKTMEETFLKRLDHEVKYLLDGGKV